MSNEELKIWVFIALGIGILFLFLAGDMILRCRKRRVLDADSTPFTEEGLVQYDGFSPGEAIFMAWSEPGDFPRWHAKQQEEVRKTMPVLARALDRMVEN